MIGRFFGANDYEQAAFPNRQVFDWEGLKGRLLSSSYAPESGHPRHVPMLEALNALFSKYQTDGKVVFEYDTLVDYGLTVGLKWFPVTLKHSVNSGLFDGILFALSYAKSTGMT